MGDGAESNFETGCTIGMPPIAYRGFQSTFSMIPYVSPIFFVQPFPSFCFRFTRSFCAPLFPISSVFFRLIQRIAFFQFISFFAPQLHINPNIEKVNIPLFFRDTTVRSYSCTGVVVSDRAWLIVVTFLPSKTSDSDRYSETLRSHAITILTRLRACFGAVTQVRSS